MDILYTKCIIICDLNHSMDYLITFLTQEEQVGLKYRHFKKGEIIFREGEKCEKLAIVIAGRISISSITYDGNEIVYNTLLPGQLFGNNLLFSKDPYYRGDVVAKEKSVLVFINKTQLKKFLKENDAFLEHYLKVQSDFSKELNAQIKMLSLGRAEERLLFFLKTHNDEYRYKTVTEFSYHLHLSREVLSRLLTKLEKEQKIKINHEKKYIAIYNDVNI